jgi:hypothetical protein
MAATNRTSTRRLGITVALAIALFAPANGCDTFPSLGVVGTVVTDVTLSSLTVSSGVLAPAFSPTILLYQLPETNDIGSITVTATTQSPGATITINSQIVASGTPSLPIAVPVGNSTIFVSVASPDTLQSLVYTINVSRAP